MINYIQLKRWYIEYKDKIDDSIIKNIYSFYDGVLFELFKPGLDKRFLYIIPGKIIFLDDKKERDETDKFILRLRKDFENKKIKIKLDEDDKIIIVESKDAKIYFELFPNGVVVVTDLNDNILYANQYKDFGVRKISKGLQYKKPPKKVAKISNFEDFYQLFKNTEKKDVVRLLAIELGLGGQYSEYILSTLGIEKNKKPNELSEEGIKKIYELYKKILDELIVIDENYNVINDVNKYFIYLFNKNFQDKKIRELEEKKKKIEKIIEEQKRVLEDIDKEINNLEKIANFLVKYSWVFNNYDIDQINSHIKDLGLNIKIYKKENNLIMEINDDLIDKL